MIFWFLLNFISLILRVGFFTLLERKILALTQNRLGPTKVLFYGLGQPLIDGLKLFKKSLNYNLKISFILFNIFCGFMLFMRFFLWLSIPFKNWASRKSYVIFWVLTIIRLNRFSVLMLGWSSIRKYSFMGSMRRICQVLSLEIILTILFISYFFLFNSTILFSFKFMKIWMLLWPYFCLFFIIIILETHRAPFDLSEGEREIVRGYNTEFRGVLFILIFLSEYFNLLFISFLLCSIILFKSLPLLSFVAGLTLLLRSCFPRVRYDVLIRYRWLKLLPLCAMLCFTLIAVKLLV